MCLIPELCFPEPEPERGPDAGPEEAEAAVEGGGDVLLQPGIDYNLHEFGISGGCDCEAGGSPHQGLGFGLLALLLLGWHLVRRRW